VFGVVENFADGCERTFGSLQDNIVDHNGGILAGEEKERKTSSPNFPKCLRSWRKVAVIWVKKFFIVCISFLSAANLREIWSITTIKNQGIVSTFLELEKFKCSLKYRKPVTCVTGFRELC